MLPRTIRIDHLLSDRRGVVAMTIALTAPVLLMALGMGIEISRWSVTQVELQRTADAAALAGILNYEHQTTKNAQIAAQAAANIAVLNGAAGQTTPTWTSSTQTLVDGTVTVAIVAGIRNSTDTAMQVTVSQSVPLYLAQLLTTSTSRTMAATATSELMGAAGTVEACVVALQDDGSSNTSSMDIQLSNGASVNTNGCVLRSDGSASFSGGSKVNANVVAAGTITFNNGASLGTGFTTQASAGQIPDPFSGNTTLQNDLTAAASSGGPQLNCTSYTCVNTTYQPGNYSSITASNGATLNLAPGLYTVDGPVNFGGGATINFPPAGVTIISSGNITINNGANVVNFSAPTNSSAVNGAIPGIVLATTATNSGCSNGYAAAVCLAGGASFAYAGAIYAPNGTLSIGNGVKNTSNGCSMVVAADFVLNGGANFSNNCTTYGLAPIYTSNNTSAALVQ